VISLVLLRPLLRVLELFRSFLSELCDVLLRSLLRVLLLEELREAPRVSLGPTLRALVVEVLCEVLSLVSARPLLRARVLGVFREVLPLVSCCPLLCDRLLDVTLEEPSWVSPRPLLRDLSRGVPFRVPPRPLLRDLLLLEGLLDPIARASLLSSLPVLRDLLLEELSLMSLSPVLRNLLLEDPRDSPSRECLRLLLRDLLLEALRLLLEASFSLAFLLLREAPELAMERPPFCSNIVAGISRAFK